jgi:hypothetical protein
LQAQAAHLVAGSRTLSSQGAAGTCIPDGVATFFHAAFTAHSGSDAGADAGGSQVQALVGHWTWHRPAPWCPPPPALRRPRCRRDRRAGGHAHLASMPGDAGPSSGAAPVRRAPPRTPTTAPRAGCRRGGCPPVPPPRYDAPARHHAREPGGGITPGARRAPSALVARGRGLGVGLQWAGATGAHRLWRIGGRAPRCRRAGRVAAPPSSCPGRRGTLTSPPKHARAHGVPAGVGWCAPAWRDALTGVAEPPGLGRRLAGVASRTLGAQLIIVRLLAV